MTSAGTGGHRRDINGRRHVARWSAATARKGLKLFGALRPTLLMDYILPDSTASRDARIVGVSDARVCLTTFDGDIGVAAGR